MHCLAPGLNYGQHTFEGVKAFRSADNKINIFRPQLNAERHQLSNDALSIPAVPEAHFIKCMDLAVGMNAQYVPPHDSGGSMYIRPVSFGSSAQLGLSPPEEYTLFVFVLPTAPYHGVKPLSCLILEDFDRAAPRGTGHVKCGGNYGPVLKWSQKAHDTGYGICLHLDSQTRTEIDEFSTAGFIGFKESKSTTDDGEPSITVVVPDSPCVIKSATSTSACELARNFGWTVEQRSIPVAELAEFVEICAAGTAASLVPIRSIDMKSTGKSWEYRGMDGNVGPLVTRLLASLKGIQSGNLPDPFGWRHAVNDPAPWMRQQEAKALAANGKAANGSLTSVDELP